MNLDSFQAFLSTTGYELLIKVLAALAFWIVGRWLIGRVVSLTQAAMNRNAMDPTLSKYVGSIVGVALMIWMCIVVVRASPAQAGGGK